MDNKEFYIGWQSQAPAGFARHTRKVIFLLAIIGLAMAITLALLQKKFSTGTFEYGQLTEVKGIYQAFPVPSLRVMYGKDAMGNAVYMTLPLVGYGKAGASGVIRELEMDNGVSFDHKQVVFKGTLIYHDGKALLQIDRHDHPMVSVTEAAEEVPAVQIDLGEVQLTGEILDPKCYFGVMKPGLGKPHRDCAIRCIEGGISPVFYVYNEKGEHQYFLMLDEKGRPMNSELKNYVAEPVSLSARAVQINDWTILYVKSGSIRRTGGISIFKSDIISCRPYHN
ncbi:MAG: hypothetical protein NTW29_17220 [Bacteroidetes bacterium]|nr:hypothetical protein [Bacteroidota bacterium]